MPKRKTPCCPALPALPDFTPAELPPWPPDPYATPRRLPEPLLWALRFLPHHFTAPPCPLHADLLRTLADPPGRYIARVAPRGHAKSTCAAFAFPLWCLCTQRRRNIVIVTHERALATQFVRDLRHELESNADLHAHYGDLTPTAPQTGSRARPTRRKWSDDYFTTANGLTVQAKSTGASFRGLRVGAHRPDLVICDDIEKDAHVVTMDARRKLEHWLRRVVMPALAPDGLLLVLGTLLHHDALLASLADPHRFPGWDHALYRAIETLSVEEAAPSPVALWPERWPLARLAEERTRLGALAFEQEYQGAPADLAEQVFRLEWLRMYDAEPPDPDRLVMLIAVDPATGASGGDFFALWVGGVDPPTGIIYTRALSLHRVPLVDQVRLIVASQQRWHAAKIGIETVAYQVALQHALVDHGRRHGLYLPVVGLRVHTRKRGRIEGLAPLIANGSFRLPLELPAAVLDQFLQFPHAGHDDAPDVCTLGLMLARDIAIGPVQSRIAYRAPRGQDW